MRICSIQARATTWGHFFQSGVAGGHRQKHSLSEFGLWLSIHIRHIRTAAELEARSQTGPTSRLCGRKEYNTAMKITATTEPCEMHEGGSTMSAQIRCGLISLRRSVERHNCTRTSEGFVVIPENRGYQQLLRRNRMNNPSEHGVCLSSGGTR